MRLPAWSHDSPLNFSAPNASVIIQEAGVRCASLNRLWVSVWNPFHPITAFVEVNLTDHGQCEHPMVGIFANSCLSAWRWAKIESVFEANVMEYVHDAWMAELGETSRLL